jgi:hypothetical protein
VGTFGTYESLGVHSKDVPLTGLATYLTLTNQRLAWVLPPGPGSADLGRVQQRCVWSTCCLRGWMLYLCVCVGGGGLGRLRGGMAHTNTPTPGPVLHPLHPFLGPVIFVIRSVCAHDFMLPLPLLCCAPIFGGFAAQCAGLVAWAGRGGGQQLQLLRVPPCAVPVQRLRDLSLLSGPQEVHPPVALWVRPLPAPGEWLPAGVVAGLGVWGTVLVVAAAYVQHLFLSPRICGLICVP